jgi:formate hydrogenlyase subunit 6/NADH:ubiquinone oxidoreductase subunit I
VEYSGGGELKSEVAEKYRYNKSVYIATIGKCGSCYYCVNACPENAIKEWNPPTVDDARCTRCMKCVEACPRNVLQIVH